MKNMTAATRPGKQHLPDMPYYHYIIRKPKVPKDTVNSRLLLKIRFRTQIHEGELWN